LVHYSINEWGLHQHDEAARRVFKINLHTWLNIGTYTDTAKAKSFTFTYG